MNKIIVEKPMKSIIEEHTNVKIYIDHGDVKQVFIVSLPYDINKIKDIVLE